MFLVGLATGVLISVAWVNAVRLVQDWQAGRRMPQPPPSAPIETYGHPFDLVGELQTHLPPAPEGMYWESGVRYGGGEPELWLGLLDSNLNTIVAETTVSFVRRGPDGLFTWADDYAYYGPQFAGDKARREIVLPLIYWAKAEVNARNKDGGIERYGIQS